MIHYPVPPNESQRLEELYAYRILDSEEEQDFTDIVELASYICNVPMSLISLIDHRRQWFKATKGIAGREMDRQIAICAHTIAGTGPFIVPDATKDKRFANFSTVTGEPHVRFYAGVPLVSPRGYNVGSLCVIHSKPHLLNSNQEKALTTLATQVIKMMEERVNSMRHEEAARMEKRQNRTLEKMMQPQRRILTILGHDARAPLYAINQLLKITGKGKISGEDLKSNLELMSNQLGATLIMIEDLLSWGKNHLSVQAAPALQQIPLYDIVTDVLDILRANAKLKGLSLANNIPSQILSPIPPTVMNFIIRNLVSNAIKFTESGTVVVTATETAHRVEVQVIDTGRGMDREQVEHLNAGTHSIVSESTAGDSGIGLIMIQEFLIQLQGELFFSSKKESGTTAVVRLPRTREADLPGEL